MKFNHFIITRFNLPIYDKTKSGGVSSTDLQYLKERIDIFKAYCLPSIKQQSVQNFKWLVLFDNSTPNEIKTEITAIEKEYPNFIPCYLYLAKYRNVDNEYVNAYNDYISKLHPGEFDSIEGNYGEYVRMIITPRFIRDCIYQHLSDSPDYIITTRLDNDDALHKDFIRTIQAEAVTHNRLLLLDYVYGYRYVLSKREVCRYCYPSGHFTTLIEPRRKTLLTSLYWVHNVVDKCVPVKHIYTNPMYVELVHKTNVINEEKNNQLSDYLFALKYFRHSHFGYKNIHLSIINVTQTLVRYFLIYSKNYIAFHLLRKS